MSVDATSLLRLEKTSLREQPLTAMRKAITTGQIGPSTHLVETDLSEALQISRGTLREAMRQLQQEGLISAGARGRLSVRHLDTKEIRDIFNVRAALESLGGPRTSVAAHRFTRHPKLAADISIGRVATTEDRIEPIFGSTAPCANSAAMKRCFTSGPRWRAASGCRSCSPASTGRSRT